MFRRLGGQYDRRHRLHPRNAAGAERPRAGLELAAGRQAGGYFRRRETDVRGRSGAVLGICGRSGRRRRGGQCQPGHATEARFRDTGAGGRQNPGGAQRPERRRARNRRLGHACGAGRGKGQAGKCAVAAGRGCGGAAPGPWRKLDQHCGNGRHGIRPHRPRQRHWRHRSRHGHGGLPAACWPTGPAYPRPRSTRSATWRRPPICAAC